MHRALPGTGAAGPHGGLGCQQCPPPPATPRTRGGNPRHALQRPHLPRSGRKPTTAFQKLAVSQEPLATLMAQHHRTPGGGLGGDPLRSLSEQISSVVPRNWADGFGAITAWPGWPGFGRGRWTGPSLVPGGAPPAVLLAPWLASSLLLRATGLPPFLVTQCDFSSFLAPICQNFVAEEKHRVNRLGSRSPENNRAVTESAPCGGLSPGEPKSSSSSLPPPHAFPPHTENFKMQLWAQISPIKRHQADNENITMFALRLCLDCITRNVGTWRWRWWGQAGSRCCLLSGLPRLMCRLGFCSRIVTADGCRPLSQFWVIPARLLPSLWLPQSQAASTWLLGQRLAPGSP